MPVITVRLLRGRTRTQKRAFIRQLTDLAVSTLAVPHQAVTVLLAEVEPDDWGSGGATMAERRASAPSTREAD